MIPHRPPRVCFSICRRFEAVAADGRRLGPIESLNAITHRNTPFIEHEDGIRRDDGVHFEVNGARMTHVSFELLRQVTLPAGVCD